MAERAVDAAYVNEAGDAIFFLTDQYVAFDYAAGSEGRVRDGVHALSTFPPAATSGFPAAFAPPGASTRLDAALRGKGKFLGASYFFRRGEYLRFQHAPAPAAFEPAHARSISLWRLPFSRVEAAFNGAGNRDAFRYFFEGSRYARYIWEEERVDDRYPKPIGNLVGMPKLFAKGIDAAVDGAGRFADAGYLFKDDRYVRFQWVNGGGEPHVDGGSKSIQDNWLGLEELLLAGKAKSQALEWLGVTRVRLTNLLGGTIVPADLAVMTSALAAHFHTTPADTASIVLVSAMFGAVGATLQASAAMFRFRTDAEAVADGNAAIAAAHTSPMPPTAATRISFTRNFKRRSERNRASTVIHEAVHVNDPASNTTATDISEWYVSPGLAPALGLTPITTSLPQFATRYDLMTTANALHNPASYATFARHNFFRVDNRENL